MISAETAKDIALAHREIEVAQKLLDDVRQALSRRETPDVRDAFGRRQDGLQLGIPSGDISQRLFNVPWSIAEAVIGLHIEHRKARLVVLNATASQELAAGCSE